MGETSFLDRVLGNKYLLLIVLFILLVNVSVIDILFFSSSKNIAQTPAPLPRPSLPVKATQAITPTTMFPGTPIPTITAVLSPTPTLIPTSTPAPTPTPTLREYFIPLGQGSGSYADWTVIPGIGAKINTANYGEIEKVYFEATVRIPTGNQTVYVRLYNANNFQPISGSDLILSGGTTTLLTSQPITLSDGENLYQVQLKTQLQYLTYVDQARIRIVSR
ncbi:MAG: hypothetical protein HY425_03435 [Candidatus Levybacteria bacterium]|nr:hypothetical protein [Candidatus Levybacteria bacterium]